MCKEKPSLRLGAKPPFRISLFKVRSSVSPPKKKKLRIIVPQPVPLDSLGLLTLSCWAPFHEISVRKDMSRIFIPQVNSLPQVGRRAEGDDAKNEKSSLLKCRQGEKSKETLIPAITYCQNLKSRKTKLCVSLVKQHLKTAHWGLDGCTAPHN
jgi:hypothetical protein